MAISKSLHALKSYTARQVLHALRRGPKSVADIHRKMKFGTRESVSHALAILLKAGLVSRHRQGRQNFYQLQPKPIQELITYLKVLHHDAKQISR